MKGRFAAFDVRDVWLGRFFRGIRRSNIDRCFNNFVSFISIDLAGCNDGGPELLLTSGSVRIRVRSARFCFETS